MSLDNLCVVGLDGYFRRLNPSWTQSLGWTTEEMLSRPSIELVHPDDRADVLAARAQLAAGIPLRRLVNRYLCKDGSYRWFEWRSVGHADRGVVYASARDVTQEREARIVLGELTDSLTTILNSIADGVIAVDVHGAIIRMNPIAEGLTGWALGEARGKQLEDVFALVDRETRAPASCPIDEALSKGVAVALPAGTLLVSRGGTELPLAGKAAPTRSGDGQVSGAVLVFRDRTAELEAELGRELLRQRLIVADRMASVGTLAAGVAHEINNPLAYVVTNLDLLIEEIPTLPATAAWVEMASDARRGTEQIRKIVGGLKTFSRAEEERRTIVDVRRVLDLSVDMTFNELRHRATLVKDYGEVSLVEVDGARLGQVFINLLLNATHAIPDGAAQAHEVRVVTSTDASGRAVIEVRDTGSGIPASALARVFDPFFTTRAMRGGTGLGLFICHNIVKDAGGEISVTSVEGRGTTFRVVLPAAPPEVLVSLAPPPGVTARRASILIVDDERSIGLVLARVLRDHDTTIMTSAKEALDLIASDVDFDVVLSDLMMPEMSGMDFHRELARIRPHIAERMVFVTGGAFTPAANAFLDRVPNPRIEKPFDAVHVRELVRTLTK